MTSPPLAILLSLTLAVPPAAPLLTTTPSGGLPPTTVASGYDKVGNRTSLIYPTGLQVFSTYDALNRLQLIKDGAATLSRYTYDALSRRVRTALQNGTGTTYRYDATNRLLQLDNVILPGFAWNRPAAWMTAMGPRAPAPLKRVVARVSDWLMPQADALPHGTNPGPQQPPSTLLSSFAYTYDPVGNRLTMTDGVGVHTYTYDPLHQLTTVDYPSGFGTPDTSYTLDPVGNRLKTVDGGTTTYVPNPLNQYASVSGVTFTYDLNGNLTFDGLNTYTYDRENHLVSATGAFGSVTYTYDAVGRRSKKLLNGTTTRYVYDGDQILEETNNAGTQQAEYVYGQGIDEPLRLERGGQQYAYFFDGLGSVIALTDSTGALVESYTYDIYGQPTTLSSVGNPFLFTGREYDAESGLYHYRARTYDPHLGRFLQRDPLGYLPDINLYRYVRNNSVNWIDPSGQNPLAIIGIGALFGGTLAFLNTLAAEAQSGGFANVQQAFGHAFVAAGIGAVAGAGAAGASFLYPQAAIITAAGFSGFGNWAYQSLSGKCGGEVNLTAIVLSAAIGAAGAGYGLVAMSGSGSIAQMFVGKVAVAGGVSSPVGMMGGAVLGTTYPVTLSQITTYFQNQLNNVQSFIQQLWVAYYAT